ncbi:IAA-amino acid hydrolase ILR1-like [Pyrus ussuriensis x Pyrus communis]|uniref:IAA-amino acid hydrolase ILR1-like n=1 Tax=Pyrus ussuriensis x Pyrus communis TaxID=2448454 RepID=A0A5N5FXL0_9ROSA|nr:IAA-amino acid hydrolase ILR1-like [Pyrus ussuriensis x Pyrus communis]
MEFFTFFTSLLLSSAAAATLFDQHSCAAGVGPELESLTGVVACIGSGSKHVFALRADMDALPLQGKEDLNPGRTR